VVQILKDQRRRFSPTNLLATLFWGDAVLSAEPIGEATKVTLTSGHSGWVRGQCRTREERLLSATFVDVGQGDACVIETPSNHRLLVDGGESQLLARYLAKRYQGTTLENPLLFDAIVVTHGDADHYKGLCTLVEEAAKEKRPGKKVVVAAKAVFHNGLVKRNNAGFPLGRSATEKGTRYVVDLHDDVRDVPRKSMNRSFTTWARCLDTLQERFPEMRVKRLSKDVDAEFSFLGPSCKMNVLGPNPTVLSDGRLGLPMIPEENGNSPSPSRTINGHSVVLMLSMGNVRILFTADLNSTAEAGLLESHRDNKLDLMAEVLKVPHHGSGDFAADFLSAVQPVVSVISSGDGDLRSEYIHPRANLVAALGKASRSGRPAVFVTEMSAFDAYRGPAVPVKLLKNGTVKVGPTDRWFYGRERVSFGPLHIRTDGRTLLAVTHSGIPGRKEAYAWRVGEGGCVEPADVETV
jgi:beta-lactamase superfamily II metal-dependent hydrolase